MTKKISKFAIMLCLASSLAFAGGNPRSASSDEATATAAASSDNATQKDKSPCGSTRETNQGKVKAKPAPSNQEPAPSNQEEEFDRVLRGIYG
jgi:hypothetical protein